MGSFINGSFLGLDSGFNETDHPRDGGGQFTSGGGSGSNSHHQALVDAGTNQEKFDAAMEHVKKLSKAELDKLLHSYASWPEGFKAKNKTDAIQKLQYRFIRNARFENHIKK